MKVLLTGMGGPAGICFAKALVGNDLVEVIGVDAGDGDFGRELVSKLCVLPMANDPQYISALNAVIDAENIDVLIPLVDEELPVVSSNIDKIHCSVLISPYETIRYTTDKIVAYEKLSAYLPKRINPKQPTFPVFVKPRFGRGGRDTHLVNDLVSLKAFDPEVYIFQEVLEPPEITIDTLFDISGKLIAISPRVRKVIESAIAIKGRTFNDPELTRIINEISAIFKFVGPINFQFMKHGDEYKLLEINARSSGGMGITVNSGVNIPLLACRMLLGETIEPVTAISGSYDNFPEIIKRQQLKAVK